MMGDETAYRGFVIDQLMQFEQAYAETLAGFEASRMTSKALTLPLLPLLTPLPPPAATAANAATVGC